MGWCGGEFAGGVVVGKELGWGLGGTRGGCCREEQREEEDEAAHDAFYGTPVTVHRAGWVVRC